MPPTKRTGSTPRGFKNLAPWRRIPLDEAERFDLLAATNDSVGYDDCFGGDPSHLMLHVGPVALAGPLVLDGWKAAAADQQTVYVLDGDLTVDGPIIFDQPDIMTTLWVTGALRATRLFCASTAMLIVGGALELSDLLITDLEDAGHLIVHGPLRAPTWLDLSDGRGCIELARPPEARFLSDHYAEPDDDDDDDDDDDGPHRPRSFPCAPASPALAPALLADGRVNQRKLLDALRKGAPILRGA